MEMHFLKKTHGFTKLPALLKHLKSSRPTNPTMMLRLIPVIGKNATETCEFEVARVHARLCAS